MIDAPKKQRLKYEIFKKLEQIISEMNYNVDAIVVEGLHDKKTLSTLGYEKPILLCSKFSRTDLTDLVAKKFWNVAILTDFDEPGIFLNKKLTNLFEKRKVRVDRFYRRRLGQLFKEAGIVTIEGIYSIKRDLFL